MGPATDLFNKLEGGAGHFPFGGLLLFPALSSGFEKPLGRSEASEPRSRKIYPSGFEDETPLLAQPRRV